MVPAINTMEDCRVLRAVLIFLPLDYQSFCMSIFLIHGTARRLLTAFIHLSDLCMWGGGRSHACELSAIHRTHTIPALVYRRRRFEDVPPCSCPDDAINKQQVNFK